MALSNLLTGLILGVVSSFVSAHPICDYLLFPSDDFHGVYRRTTESTFSCPIFDDYHGGYKTCSSEDLIWDAVKLYGKTVTFYIPPDESEINYDKFTHIISIIQESTRFTLAIYEGWEDGIHINIGLVGEIPGGSYGWTLAHTSGDEFDYCNVLINFPVDEDPDKRVKKAVAHELYHCIQSAANLAGMRSGDYEQTLWWVEGSARFFDGYSYPIEGKRDTMLSLGTFPEEYDPEISIVEQTYAVALYFHFLIWEGVSVSTINNWVISKHGRDNTDEDVNDIADMPLFSHNWHGFARAFVDDAIWYNKNVLLDLERDAPSETYNTESIKVGEQASIPYNIKPFTFSQPFFNFSIGTKWKIGFPSGVDVSMRAHREEGWHTATGSEFNVEITDEIDFVVEVVGSCARATLCHGNFIVERLS